MNQFAHWMNHYTNHPYWVIGILFVIIIIVLTSMMIYTSNKYWNHHPVISSVIYIGVLVVMGFLVVNFSTLSGINSKHITKIHQVKYYRITDTINNEKALLIQLTQKIKNTKDDNTLASLSHQKVNTEQTIDNLNYQAQNVAKTICQSNNFGPDNIWVQRAEGNT